MRETADALIVDDPEELLDVAERCEWLDLLMSHLPDDTPISQDLLAAFCQEAVMFQRQYGPCPKSASS